MRRRCGRRWRPEWWGSAVRRVVFGRVRRLGAVLLRRHVLWTVLRQPNLYAPPGRATPRRLLAPPGVRHPEPPAPRVHARHPAATVSLVRAAQLRRHHQRRRSSTAATAAETVPRTGHQKARWRVRGAYSRGRLRDRYHARGGSGGGCSCGRRETVGRCVAADEIQVIICGQGRFLYERRRTTTCREYYFAFSTVQVASSPAFFDLIFIRKIRVCTNVKTLILYAQNTYYIVLWLFYNLIINYCNIYSNIIYIL